MDLASHNFDSTKPFVWKFNVGQFWTLVVMIAGMVLIYSTTTRNIGDLQNKVERIDDKGSTYELTNNVLGRLSTNENNIQYLDRNGTQASRMKNQSEQDAANAIERRVALVENKLNNYDTTLGDIKVKQSEMAITLKFIAEKLGAKGPP